MDIRKIGPPSTLDNPHMANQLHRSYKRVYGIRRWGTPPVASTHELFLKGGQSNATSQETIDDWQPGEGQVDEPDERILEYSVGRNAAAFPSVPGWSHVPAEGETFTMGIGPNQDDQQQQGVAYPLHVSKRRLARLGNHIEQQLWLNLARGGTGFSDNRWNPGDDLYTEFVQKSNELRAAHPQFDLRAFIWSNSENEMLANWSGNQFYNAQKALIEGLRGEVTGASDETPFIFVKPPANFAAGRPTGPDIVDASVQLAKDLPNVYYLDHGGLQATQDGVHFEALELRAIGAQLESLLYRIGLVAEAPGPITVS